MNLNPHDILNELLVPAGNGVFTVHTAKEHKELLHQSYYKSTCPNEVKLVWKNKLKDFASSQHIGLLGIPADTGGGIQRGANWGPLFIRNKLLNDGVDQLFEDLGDIKVIPHLLHDKYLNKKTLTHCKKVQYQGKTLPVSPLSIAETVYDTLFALNPHKRLFGLGGDHSVSYPLVRSWLKHKKSQNKKVAIIHFDAHTDLLVERLGIDICFGSWAYHMLEFLDNPKDMIQFGIRSSGKDRNHWESSMGVQQFWTQEIKNNLQEILDKTLNYLKTQEVEELYISFDIDALDISYASCTGTPESGGLEPHQCRYLIEGIAQEFKVTGADLVEVAPFVRSPYQDPKTVEPEATLSSSSIIANALLEAMNYGH